MGRCRHERQLAHSWWDNHWIEEPYIRLRDAALIRCVDCGETLPLGPANDGDERVRIELRAAEIVQAMLDEDENFDGDISAHTSLDEAVGWHSLSFDNGYFADNEQGCAGRLAHEIATARDEGDL